MNYASLATLILGVRGDALAKNRYNSFPTVETSRQRSCNYRVEEYKNKDRGKAKHLFENIWTNVIWQLCKMVIMDIQYIQWDTKIYLGRITIYIIYYLNLSYLLV